MMDYSTGLYTCLSVLWILTSTIAAARSDNTFRIAALFEPEHEGMVLALQNAVSKVNIREKAGPGKKILVDLEYVDNEKSFDVNRKVCRQMKGKIAAVFGPVSASSRGYVESVCQTFQIPHIQAVWDPRETREYYAVNVYPDHAMLSKAYADLIKHWAWTRFTVVYEDNNGLIRLQKILENARGSGYEMTVRQLETYQMSYKSVLKEIKDKHQYRLVIDCDVEKIPEILDQADSLGMVSSYFHFHFLTLDLSVLDLDRYQNKGANITAMRLISPKNPKVQNIMAEWSLMETNVGRSPLRGMRAIKTETALVYDAMNMFARAIASTSMSRNLGTQVLNCNKPEVTWSDGDTLLNNIKASTYNGLSGKIDVKDGQRKEIELDIISLTSHGLIDLGKWTRNGVNITVTVEQQKHDDLERLRNTTLHVVTIFDPPYAIKRTEPDEVTGRMEEGFIVDLLDELSAALGFNYSIYEQEKRGYGSEGENGKWDGMIGDLIERDSKNKADLAAAGLTITYDRARVVDFSMPFLNLGITIIYKKPVKTPPDLFSFLSPLSIDVWIYMIAAYLCVSFMLFVIARFTPYEWENPHPCDQESEEVENQFTILNSLWFTIGSLMQQGSDIAPKALSSRFVASSWYMFTLIIVSSYTANLAAFLTVRRMDSPIKNAKDLSLQTDIGYGTLAKGSTREFFKNDNRTVYKRMNSYMTINEDRVMVKGNAEGFERVKNHNYAFLAESTSIDYQVQRNCDLTQIGELIDDKGYGLAAPKDVFWLKYLSQEIVNLQQKQVISKIYDKWWVEKSNVKCKQEDGEKTNNNALGVRNVGGVFVVLAGGSIFAFFVAILEFLWKVGRNARKDKQSFWSEMTEELAFVVKCKSSRNLGKTPSQDRVDNNGVKYSPADTRPDYRDS